MLQLGDSQNNSMKRGKARGWAVKSLEISRAPLNPSPNYAWSPRGRRLGELSLTPDMLPYSKCHSALYMASSSPQESLSQGVPCSSPEEGCRESWQQGKLAAGKAATAPAHSSPLPPTPWGMFTSRERGSVLPALAPSRMRLHRAGSRQDPPLARAAHNQQELLNHMHLGCTVPDPPSKWESFPGAGWSKPCPCTQRTRRRGCSRLSALLGDWHRTDLVLPSLGSFLEAGPGCTAASNLVGGWRN